MWNAIPLSLVISENRNRGFFTFFLGNKICNCHLICEYLYFVKIQMAHLEERCTFDLLPVNKNYSIRKANGCRQK